MSMSMLERPGKQHTKTWYLGPPAIGALSHPFAGEKGTILTSLQDLGMGPTWVVFEERHGRGLFNSNRGHFVSSRCCQLSSAFFGLAHGVKPQPRNLERGPKGVFFG